MLVSYFTYALLKLRVTWECEIFALRQSCQYQGPTRKNALIAGQLVAVCSRWGRI